MTLEEKIKYYADNYYAGNTLISDEEFDALCETARIPSGLNGSDLKGVTKMYDLPVPMGTLEKCMTEEDFTDWFIRNAGGNQTVTELKIDGCGALLQYIDGKLNFIYSRGDSEKGADLTENVRKVKNIPDIINTTSSNVCIRGEVVMRRSVFNEFFKGVGKNPRNMCAGIIKRLDGTDCDKLDFIAYDVFNLDSNNDEDFADTEINKLKFLSENGFTIPSYEFNQNLDDIIKWRNELETEGEIPCDGLVIKQNIVDIEDLMRKTPMKNIAFKPNLQVAVSTLLDIEWNLAGSQFSPVAIFEPVELEGTTVNRASLSNINIMEKLGIQIGDKIFIEKRGLIIPKVIGKV